jgi:hypothetical protein
MPSTIHCRSELAKVVNDDARILVQRGVLRFFASKLAPTEKRLFSRLTLKPAGRPVLLLLI